MSKTLKNKNQINKILNEYDKNIKDVRKLKIWFEKKLSKAIKSSGLSEASFKGRVKEKQSLENKLYKFENIKSLRAVEDLIGFRVVFSLEKDVYKFVSHIYSIFHRRNIQYRRRFSINGYNSDHIIIKISPKFARAKNKSFVGKLIEIQVTSLLYYHWTMITHDILYKDKYGLKKFSPYNYEYLEEKFKKVMENFIKPATHQLDVLDSVVIKARKGQHIQGPLNFKNLEEEVEVYPIYSGLCEINSSIDEFSDCSSVEFPLIKLLTNMVERLDAGKIKEKGQLGFDREDIIRVILDILSNRTVLWRNPESVFGICWKFANYEDEYIAKKAKENILAFCELKLKVAQSLGLAPQQSIYKLLSKINVCSDNEMIILLEFLSRLGKLEIDDSYTDGDSFIIRKGVPTISRQLKTLRSNSIKLFISMIFNAKPILRKEYLSRLHNFFWLAPMRKSSDEAIKEVRRSAKLIVKLLSERLDSASIPDLLLIFNELEFLQSKNSMLGASCSFALNKIRSNPIIAKILAIKPTENVYYSNDKLNQHFDQILQAMSVDEIIDDVDMIQHLMRGLDESGQNILVNVLCQYCARIAEVKPECLSNILYIVKESYWVEYAFVLGALNRKDMQYAKKYLDYGLAKKTNLDRCISLLEQHSVYKSKIASEIFNLCVLRNDLQLIKQLGCAVFLNLNKPGAVGLICKIADYLFDKEQAMFLKSHSQNWNMAINFMPVKVCKKILATFLHNPSIDNECDHIIADFGKKYPKELLIFLDARIALEKKREKQESKRNYEAIPHSLYWINSVLHSQKKVLVPKILNDVILGKCSDYTASKLLESTWEGDSMLLVNSAINSLNGKSKKKKLRIFSFFRFFENKSAAVLFAERFVEKNNDWHSYKSELYMLVEKQGVVSGDDGFLKAHKSDLAMAKEKIKINAGKLKAFWQEFYNSQKNTVALEERHVERARATKEMRYN